MRKVYIPNNSGHDFSKAEEFGKLVFISEGLVPEFQINQMYRKAADALEDSEPEDYVLVTGLTQINVVATSVFAYLHDRLNLLIYDAKKNEYVSRKIMLGNLLSKKEIKEDG